MKKATVKLKRQHLRKKISGSHEKAPAGTQSGDSVLKCTVSASDPRMLEHKSENAEICTKYVQQIRLFQ
jgi:hypothetical protein